MRRIQLAVRDFALPVPRKGSIEVHSGYSLLPQTGDEAHRQAQNKRAEQKPGYRCEVKISHSFERADYTFVVSGRIDGLIDATPPYLEEIKTAFNARELADKLRAEPDHPYCLQLKTYAYIYTIQNACVPAMGLHVASYVTEEEVDVPLLLDMSAYEGWLDRRLDELVAEAEFRQQEKERRKRVSKRMAFPFARPRAGQMELVDTIERTFTTGDALMIQAPTGLGKTAGVIFPSLRDALDRGQKLIYVTPKNSQHHVAQDAVKRLQKEGNDVRTLTLTAKGKICFKGEPVCNPEHCEFARDYYAKVYEHNLVEEVANYNNMDAEVFTEIGKEYEVCPFELAVDSLNRADVIIGDYNYVFSPISLLGRFTQFVFGEREKPNLVIDEAHNLPTRAMDYFSPSLSTGAVTACRERVQALPLDLRMEAHGLMTNCLGIITKFEPSASQKQIKTEIPASPFLQMSEQLSHLLNSYLQVVPTPKPGDPIIGLCHQWSAFAEQLAALGESFFTTSSRDGNSVTLKITCCDASEQIRKCAAEFEHVVAFSATLKPFDYYRQLCGFSENKVQTVEFTSPFPAQNRKLIVIPQVSTKYSDRSKNCPKIAEAIERIVHLRNGNYFVFFPSFAFLRQVYDAVNLPGFAMLKQEPGMTAIDVQKFMDALRNSAQPTVIFAVQGGVFSEGVDYPGDMLIGAIIVGPALPGFDLERELIREYFDKKFGNGFDYAYTYPAMARVVQSAGRVIRSENDRGLIVLMDKRFTAPSYAATMPGDWYQQSVSELVSRSILKDIESFWSEG